MNNHGAIRLISQKKDGYVIRSIYRCPCGNGTIVEEQDYTPGHRSGMAFINCSSCKLHCSIDFGESETKWELHHNNMLRNVSSEQRLFKRNKQGVKSMNINNVFYFKKIVDELYPDEKRPAVDTQSVVRNVKENIKSLSDSDFCEVIISCFIPDLYSGMGKREKLFTKLTELMVGEWWRRMGGTYRLPTKKSGTEDVELKYNKTSIVCDAKVFRLGRSQKAPNVKDFLKLASVALWIKNLEKSGSCSVVGGLVTYSSLHEWESDSEVYEECTNLETPVVMLPYEVMALLLKYKDRVNISEFLKLWNYSDNQVKTSRDKKKYWDYITRFLCDLISITNEEFLSEMKEYHRRILLAVSEYRSLVQNTIDSVKATTRADLDRFRGIDELKEYAVDEIVKRDNSLALDYLIHIDDFRYYRDQD